MKLAKIEINNKQNIFFWISLVSFISTMVLADQPYIKILIAIMYISALYVFSFQDRNHSYKNNKCNNKPKNK